MDARGRRADRVHAGAARALVVVWLCTSVHVAVAQPKPRSLWSGDLEKAAQLFGEALAADPGDADAATNLGQALARLGRRAEAERALREAIRLQPAREWAWVGLAELFADDPRRWERRDEIVAFLGAGLARVAGEPSGSTNLSIALANFERPVGRTE